MANPQAIAVVLFNLGAPEDQDSVRPFLKNLFSDKSIINLPGIMRIPLAWFISWRRTPKAKKIYQTLGGGSPLLANTLYQKVALEEALKKKLPDNFFQVFVAMRYWHPLIPDVAKQVAAFNPDRIILLPLYPQYSCTTTGSSLKKWHASLSAQLQNVPSTEICCYPTDSGVIKAHRDLLEPLIHNASFHGRPRILFSAHGLPQSVIDSGDPYEEHIKITSTLVAEAFVEKADSVICYQSRVGPMRWLSPSLEQEIHRASKDNVPIIVCPISFVSDHSETLVELDVQYRELALKLGVPFYGRVPALATHPAFIEGLVSQINGVLEKRTCHAACPEAFLKGCGARCYR